MSDLEDKLEQIKTALAELRATASDGPATRKQLDSLFRQVHSLKAVASADGLTDLSRAAHELENVLHALRTGESTLDSQALQQLEETYAALKAEEKHALRQSLEEGAKLFLVQTSFDPAERQLRRKTHETIRRITTDVEQRIHLNTVVSALMELVNVLSLAMQDAAFAPGKGNASGAVLREAVDGLIVLLAPMARRSRTRSDRLR